MNRTADYTIEGFLYQFHKTLLEILTASDDASIMVEGVIEDIDVTSPDGICAIQCKYHESHDRFTLSALYKPILDMMRHFVNSPDSCVNYRLYAYFPNESGKRNLTKGELEEVLNSKNKEHQPTIDKIKGKIDLNGFLQQLTVEFGKSLSELEKEASNELVKAGLPKDEIETLIYPNAINEIAKLSAQHNENRRITTKKVFTEALRKIRTTAINHWTLSLKSYKKILDAKKKQLKSNLSKNSRLRYFVFSRDAIDAFNDEIVNFVQEYLEKYHYKEAHISTPLFCLDCSPEEFDDIRVRIHKKGISFTDGFVVANVFDEKHFFREPIASKQKGIEHKVEFRLRVLRFEGKNETLWERTCDDMFVVSNKAFDETRAKDVNIEYLGINTFRELKYILGMSDGYE